MLSGHGELESRRLLQDAHEIREKGMRKLFLCGRSEAGKTSLTQALKNEDLHYEKTQAVNTWDITIDCPGEYAETKELGFAMACFSFEADVLALLCAADEPFDLHGPGYSSFANRPFIGIVTKINSPRANVPMVSQWLWESGCERIFAVDNLTGEGIEELREYLEQVNVSLTLDEAIELQNRGIKV